MPVRLLRRLPGRPSVAAGPGGPSLFAAKRNRGGRRHSQIARPGSTAHIPSDARNIQVNGLQVAPGGRVTVSPQGSMLLDDEENTMWKVCFTLFLLLHVSSSSSFDEGTA